MPLTYEYEGSKKPGKINTYMLTRAELLITLCYETPCSTVATVKKPVLMIEKSFAIRG